MMIPRVRRTIPWYHTARVHAMLLSSVMLGSVSSLTDAADRATVQLRLDGAPIEGTPVAWTNANALLLRA